MEAHVEAVPLNGRQRRRRRVLKEDLSITVGEVHYCINHRFDHVAALDVVGHVGDSDVGQIAELFPSLSLTEPLGQAIARKERPFHQFISSANPLRRTQEGAGDVLAEVTSRIRVETIVDKAPVQPRLDSGPEGCEVGAVEV